MVFIDDYSKYTWTYFLKTKSEVPQVFSTFKAQVENILQKTIKILRTDGGAEYKPIQQQHPQIIHQKTCPHTPQQNGAADRKHRHLIELSLASMAHASIPAKYWDKIISSTTCLINRLPNHNKMIPYTTLFQKQPDFLSLRVLGCLCFPYTRPYNTHKLEQRAVPCVFLGYALSQKGYRCLHIPSNKIFVSRHVQFNEEKFPFRDNQLVLPSSDSSASTILTAPLPIIRLSPSNNTHTHTTTTIAPNSAPNFPELNTPQPVHTPTPPPPPPPPQITTHSMTTRNKDNTRKTKTFPNHITFLTALESEPTTYTKAASVPEWRQAMALEIEALARNNTWTLVPPPQDQRIIGCKWVYKVKKRSDGSIDRYKARLVAKGFNQVEGVDFFETYSPVVRPATIRVILSLAISSGWTVRQLDVQNAFLHGDLTEKVYMSQPQGFVDPAYPNHVCLLSKSLYGLKQAPRAWFQKLSSTLIEIGFQSSQYDPSLFYSHTQGGSIFVLVYVDDILIIGTNTQQIASCISLLHSKFAIKDLGDIHFFLGIEAIPSSDGLILNQTKYITELLTKTNMITAKPVMTPMATYITLTKDDSPPFEDTHKYCSVVGALQYATLTRPDISFAVNKCSQFMHSPTENHWTAVKRILRYLCGTVHHGLKFHSKSAKTLHAYSDADWAGSTDDRRSTSGFCLFLGQNLISWSAKKQPTVSRSSTEAEYRSLALASAEILWLQNLLKELHVQLSEPPILWCDNIGATFLASNPSFHARTKHIEIDYHFVRERIVNKEISARFLCSADQIADVLTKPLSTTRHQYLSSKLNVVGNQLACTECLQ